MKIGIDLGGTKTEGVVLSDDNKVLHRLRRPTPHEQGYDAILANITEIVHQLESQCGQYCSTGIGTPGSIDKHTRLLKYSNTVCMNDRPLLDDLQAQLNRELRIENDANCFALSEAIDGAGAGFATVFGIILGTGTGGGVIVDKRIIKGPNGMAGEWGHTVFDPAGPKCYCGQHGCIEMYLSGPALISAYINHGGHNTNRVEDIVQAAASGENIACNTLDQYYTHFARAISGLIKILDPEAIILGGGVSHIDALYTTGKARVQDYFSHPVDANILKNRHGDSSGVRGAAYLWD